MNEARLQAEKLAAGKVDAAEMTGGDQGELAAARDLADDTPLLSALREWREAHKLAAGNVLTAVRFYAEHFRSGSNRVILI